MKNNFKQIYVYFFVFNLYYFIGIILLNILGLDKLFININFKNEMITSGYILISCVLFNILFLRIKNILIGFKKNEE